MYNEEQSNLARDVKLTELICDVKQLQSITELSEWLCKAISFNKQDEKEHLLPYVKEVNRVFYKLLIEKGIRDVSDAGLPVIEVGKTETKELNDIIVQYGYINPDVFVEYLQDMCNTDYSFFIFET